jgi:muramoyltetrapeptide carboxypeptidase
MDRKKFLQSATLLGLPALGAAQFTNEEPQILNIPKRIPFLKKGDVVGITSPAGFITETEIEKSLQLWQSWGFTMQIGNTIGKRWNTFGGTDQERKDDLQQMLDDKNIKAILCARGGYGCGRIVDDLDFTKFKKHPKWLIGFSDITVLLCQAFAMGYPSMHSKMLNSYPSDGVIDDTHNAIPQLLKGVKINYQAPAHAKNKLGKISGKLIGGNLSLLANIVGSKSDIDTRNCILFLEEVSEKYYSLDRMMWCLKRSGKLNQLAGLIIGGMNRLKDDETDPFGQTHYDIIDYIIKDYKYPVCYDFPVGHQRNNMPLLCGFNHQLTVTAEGSVLKLL